MTRDRESKAEGDTCNESVTRPDALRVSESEIAASHQQLRTLLVEQVERCHRWADAYRTWAPEATSADLVEQLTHLLAGTPTPELPPAKGPAQTPSIAPCEREIRSACMSAIQPLRVVYLGPEYSYSHLAALERFGQNVTLLPVATISTVFEEVARGQAEFGIVPLENSTDGRIADTLDVLAREPATICGEVQIRIHHCLWGSGKISDVRQVHSKPQALSQCRHWLAHHMPDVECLPSGSTTVAARLALQDIRVAAVASRPAGHALGLNLLAENIEDRPDNVTRFAVVGPSVNRRSGNDKTSLMFELPHRPGALADAMVVFKKNRLNLTWIESFPKPASPQEYVFFVEFLGHTSDPRTRRALRDLEPKTVRVTVLGSYPASSPV